MSRVAFWGTWLGAVGVAMVAAGAVLALLAGTPAFDIVNRIFDSVFRGATGPDPATQSFRAWTYGAWGAVIAGWGLSVTALGAVPLRRGESWASWTVALGTAAWFVLDEGVSISHGVWPNVILNLVILAAVALSLTGARRALRHAPSSPPGAGSSTGGAHERPVSRWPVSRWPVSRWPVRR